jgi:hypothetical protein
LFQFACLIITILEPQPPPPPRCCRRRLFRSRGSCKWASHRVSSANAHDTAAIIRDNRFRHPFSSPNDFSTVSGFEYCMVMK